MKKLAVILGSCVLMFTLLVVGAGFWLKGHVGDISRQMTGMEVHFSSLSVHYFPMPIVVLNDVSLKEGQNSLKIPALKLYPDFGKILSGRFQIKKAVLEEPLLVAQGVSAKSFASQTFWHSGSTSSTNVIPAGLVMVNRGRVLLKTLNGGTVIPVSVTAQAEGGGQGLSIQLKNASIDEIGLKFSGDVNIESFAPLKLKINARQGTFNPGAVRDFLVKFGYLTAKAAADIPNIKNVACSKIELTFDAASGGLDLTADKINVDQMIFRKVAVKLSHGDNFEVGCSDGVVDAAGAYAWLQQNPGGRKMLEDALAHARLKALTARGEVRISALHFLGSHQGALASLKVDGSVEAKAQGLVLNLTAKNGAKQNFTIGLLDTKITVRHGKPFIKVDKFKFNSSKGGRGRIRAAMAIPLDLKQISLQISINALKVFDTTVYLHVNKDGQPKSVFDLALTSSSLKITADGFAYLPGGRNTDLDLRLTNLLITHPAPDSSTRSSGAKAPLEQHFDFSAIGDRAFSARAYIKNCQIGSLTAMKNVALQFKSENGKALLNGTMRICGINLVFGSMVSPPGRLAATIETRGTDLDLTSFIACFSNELPVYLTGRLSLNGNFSATGNSVQSIIDTAAGSVVVTVARPEVQRLSGLDPRLAFFLDILRAAGVSSDKEDSIKFRRAVVNANLERGRVIIDRFSLAGPLFSAWGRGNFTIKGRHLKLSGSVKTALGVTTGLNIDRILEKKET